MVISISRDVINNQNNMSIYYFDANKNRDTLANDFYRSMKNRSLFIYR